METVWEMLATTARLTATWLHIELRANSWYPCWRIVAQKTIRVRIKLEMGGSDFLTTKL